ncbi:MAG: hypothetical protein ACD_57C00350G0004 [uncultured bacterium]|uniref:Uncharacterized protein n=1 Tax=Candidatus Woesebacteria bacterium RIFCSPHIGHO2_12_FULL_41_24 TaxID=1802510 RepID=A0A1F8AT95_9BACT|nr:MAG: hypothetical protein ACD_57C00350G0004 [uncultured bacterium]OGM14800.1 MAG: hypothetical protein A2W15_00480 [Candidatus Woesebacteria bacterium RBG_16_41_13]OGM30293.1 MAG: hypothetical protein A2873_05185 [Candidatus Woesebacteria bacterium RIFCSPHIGHO2_01_FULL_42_80]OGM34332.1 MAG: hypothetical protein A3D84_04770 [Candidatus Woesebacteria bacterium RIFCSPHIGHO2_02_FULL_42_20]OGM54983.1 MAG: hypothetical protein A3E44_05040 [Candidatus Woesebacteria bacterium RIFCSPHIGHO2_12_FULL_41
MKFVDKELTKTEILSFRKKYGNYIKLTVDVENEWIVAGGDLHADGEKVLLEKGSRQNDIWGGGINFFDKQIDTTAVLNIRPRLNNDNLEILNSKIRKEFHDIIKRYFGKLWH